MNLKDPQLIDGKFLAQHQFQTLLGTMVAVSDLQNIYVLGFSDQLEKRSVAYDIQKLLTAFDATLIESQTDPINQLQSELMEYFSGTLKHFTVSLKPLGTYFQNLVWKELLSISYGTHCSYYDIAHAIKKPKAVRAVGSAVGSNPISLCIPCHRVVHLHSGLGCYRWGIERKQWFLKHEAALYHACDCV